MKNMNGKEYNEARGKLEKEHNRQMNEIEKEYQKGFIKKYFKNTANLIAMSRRDREGDLVFNYLEIDDDYPDYYDVDFSREYFVTVNDFIAGFDKKCGGGTPVEITKEGFIDSVMANFKKIVEG